MVDAAEATRRGDVRIVRVDWDDERAAELRRRFDAEMDERYDEGAPPPREVAQMLGEVFATNLDDLRACILLVDPATGVALAHGALFARPEPRTLELRKVTVPPEHRRRGLARNLLVVLEAEACHLGAERLVLDTGPKQPEAVALYEAVGYRRIPPFPPYDRLGEGGAICFERNLDGDSAGR